MPKLTLDMNTFKALASDTRLDILRTLDGKKMNLNDMCKATNLNKSTLHEHLTKLNEAGLIKKNEREGHKWVYYKLTWKGEGLLHPENTRIVVMFSTTFISLLIAVILIVNFLQPIPVGIAETIDDTTYLYEVEGKGIPLIGNSFSYNYLGEIDAKNKTVGNITTELQNKAPPVNSIGDNYDDEDIAWFIVDSASISTNEDSNYLKLDNSRSLEQFNIPKSLQGGSIDNSQDILYSFYDINRTIIGMNSSTNNTERPNTTGENKTNEPSSGFVGDNTSINQSSLGYENKENYLGSYPLVPSMIATVHDTTFLFFAVACITFFGILFTLSTWRLWVNKKQRL
ncbi:MAG: winged helix-turn-helix domain-containing protein [Candidatus Thermoplasmatota archaeon]|nr:winged helix-turn-helix domain-containing protein [Candidatus Thermoplasmatota archaeon]